MVYNFLFNVIKKIYKTLYLLFNMTFSRLIHIMSLIFFINNIFSVVSYEDLNQNIINNLSNTSKLPINTYSDDKIYNSQLYSNNSCSLCNDVVNIINSEIHIANSTINIIEHIVKDFCSLIVIPLQKKECLFFLYHIQDIINMLLSGLSPKDICIKLGFCS